MLELVNKLIGDKKEYKEQMARAAALPEDYRFVFEKMQKYMWRFAGGDGMDMLNTQYDLIELFENGAAEGRHVLEVTGDDVAGFCDEFMRDTIKWRDSYRNKLNREIGKQGEVRPNEHDGN